MSGCSSAVALSASALAPPAASDSFCASRSAPASWPRTLVVSCTLPAARSWASVEISKPSPARVATQASERSSAPLPRQAPRLLSSGDWALRWPRFSWLAACELAKRVRTWPGASSAIHWL
ncbi:hypothetical protein D3C87_1125800 [compost metagenome]